MKKPTNSQFLMLASAIFISFFFWASPNSYGAFVPISQPIAQKQAAYPNNLQNAYLKLAFMTNKDIEEATGKKLTLKEKIGLHFFRKEFRKKNNHFLKSVQQNPDDCFTMYLKNGDVLEVKLIQITQNEIKYQRCNKPGDPEIVISKSNVFSIKDKSGETIFNSQSESWKRGTGNRTGPTDSAALASGILGIASLTVGLIFWPVGLAAGIVAFVLGLSALRRFRNDPKITGEGWAITGVAAGGLWIFFGLLLLIGLALWY